MTNPDQVSYIQNQIDSREVVIGHFKKDLLIMLESLIEVLGDKPYKEIKGIFTNVIVNIYLHRYGNNKSGCKKLGVNRGTFRKWLSNCNDL